MNYNNYISLKAKGVITLSKVNDQIVMAQKIMDDRTENIHLQFLQSQKTRLEEELANVTALLNDITALG